MNPDYRPPAPAAPAASVVSVWIIGGPAVTVAVSSAQIFIGSAGI